MLVICHGLKEEDFHVGFVDHKIFIGRDNANSIVIGAEGTSRFHAVLIEEDDELYLKDNDSLNGTFLNNKQVQGRQRVVLGDIIQIGYYLIKVDIRPDQNVVLDFVQIEQSGVIPQNSTSIPSVPPEPKETPVASDDRKRTTDSFETPNSHSSSLKNATETLDMMDRISQTGEKIAGESTIDASTDSCIVVSSRLSLWRLIIHDKWIVLSSLFIVCALCILFFFLGRRSAMNNRAEVERYNGDPLLVTTDQDILDPNDGVNSLREALFHAQNYCLYETITFEKDCVIRLKEPLAVFNPVSIDGGKKDITIIGPETEPMFRVKDSSLTVKNMTLLSDRSGDDAGIMDISFKASGGSDRWIYEDFDLDTFTSGLVRLISVKDGGKARKLWSVSSGGTGRGMVLERGSHIHRLYATTSDIRVSAGSVLEDATINYFVRITIRGTLKNATISDHTNAYLYEGGTCENLTIDNSLSYLTTGNGTVKGLNVGGELIYEPGCTLSGTITIGGRASTTYPDRPLVYPKHITNTDIIFDLTNRSSGSRCYLSPETDIKQKIQIHDSVHYQILYNISGFLWAHSFTIQVSISQTPGIYLLAGDAAEFNSPVSLMIGDITYSDVLSVGKSFTKDGKVYSLSLMECQTNNLPGNKDILVLTVQ